MELANLHVGSAAMSCSFSVDGKYILVGTQNSTLHLFVTSSFEEIHILYGHRLGVRTSVFSKDSKNVFSGALDTDIMIWEINSFLGKGKHVHGPTAILRGHAQGVRAVACNPRNPDQIASGGDDCCVFIWSISKMGCSLRMSGHTGSIYSIAYTPSGRFIITGSHDSTVRIWNQSSGICTFHGHSGPVFAVLASSDEYSALSAGADSTIRTWDLRGLLRSENDEASQNNTAETFCETGSIKQKETKEHGQYGCINALSFSPDGIWLLSVSSDNTYAIRKTENGKLKDRPIRGHIAPVTCCQFHPEGKHVLTGSEDKFLKIWDPQSNILKTSFQGHSKSVTGACFFPTGTHFVSCSLDSTIRVWDVMHARESYKIDSDLGHKNTVGQSAEVRCCSVSPNNHVFASGGDDHILRIWDDRLRTSVQKCIGHRNNITSCMFSGDGSMLLSASLDCSVFLWDLRGSIIHRFQDHSAPVSSVSFSSSGRHFVSGSWDKFVIAYSSSTLKEVGRWCCSSACHSVAASSQFSVSFVFAFQSCPKFLNILFSYQGSIACGDTTGATFVLRTVLAPCAQWRFF